MSNYDKETSSQEKANSDTLTQIKKTINRITKKRTIYKRKI